MLGRAKRMNEADLIKVAAETIEKHLSSLCTGIYKVGRVARTKQQIKCGKAFTEYLQRAINKYSKMKTILYRDNRVSLYSLYEHLTLKHQNVSVDSRSINNVLDVGKNILIMGTGGSGKSTLLKHLFLNTIENTELIPVFVELREINDLPETATIVDCIYKSLTNLQFALDVSDFLFALKSGKFVLFFDAFDEVVELKKQSVQNQILELVDKYAENYFIVSSRELGENHRFIGWTKFIHLRVAKLSKVQALSLVRKLDYEAEIKEKFLQQLEQNLYERYVSFASNPLLLTILLLTYDQYADIPEKMHLFYQECFNTLYSRHDASKGGFKRVNLTKLPLDDFSQLLSHMSAASYFQQKRSFSTEELLGIIKDASEADDIQVDPECYKNDLIEALCLLVQDGLEYIYSHRSFQEYFTAKYISNLEDTDQKKIYRRLLESVPDTVNEDIVISLLFEMNRTRLEKNLIIPTIQEMIKLTHADSLRKRHFNYLKLVYSQITHDLSLIAEIKNIKKEEEAVGFSVVSHMRKYGVILDFIWGKYADHIPHPKFDNAAGSVQCIKRYAEDLESVAFGEWVINLDDKVLCHSDLLDEILQQGNFSTIKYDYASDVLGYIKIRHKTQQSRNNIMMKLPVAKKRNGHKELTAK